MPSFLKDYSTPLIRGVASVSGLRILGILIGYAFVFMVARLFGASALGEYQLAVQLIGTCCLISMLGFNQLTLKYAARLKTTEEGWSALRRLYKKWAGISFAAGIASSILLIVFSELIAINIFNDIESKKYILLASVIVPFQVFTNLACEFFRGIGLIPLSEYLRSIHVRVINFGVLGGLILLLGKNDDFLVQSFVFASFSAFVLAIFAIWKSFGRQSYSAPRENTRGTEETLSFKESFGQSLPMYQSALLIFVSTQALIFILAYFENPAEVAKYNVCLKIANLTSFIFSSVVTIAAPMYSRDFAENQDKLKASIRESSRLIFWTSGSVSLLIACLSYPLLLVFGQDFAAAWPVLVILAAGSFINSFTGATGVLLDMTGEHNARKNILFANALLTIVIAFFSIQNFGIIGIALSYFFNMCFGNFLCVYVVYRKLGINMIYLPGTVK